MLEGGGVPFSVVYFDGDCQTNVGEVTVDPSLNFKNFQTVLSQKIGISPHQLSVYLASQGSNRKIPITGKVNFAAIAREKGTFFFVKRSRRPRRHKTHKEFQNDECYSSTKAEPPNKKIPPANVMLLRRNTGTDNHPFSGFNRPIIDRVEYENRVRNLQIERERYLMNMRFGGLDLGRERNGGGERNANGGDMICEECSRANETGRDVGFHWCVHDAVTVGFRSPAGPIARPIRSSE